MITLVLTVVLCIAGSLGSIWLFLYYLPKRKTEAAKKKAEEDRRMGIVGGKEKLELYYKEKKQGQDFIQHIIFAGVVVVTAVILTVFGSGNSTNVNNIDTTTQISQSQNAQDTMTPQVLYSYLNQHVVENIWGWISGQSNLDHGATISACEVNMGGWSTSRTCYEASAVILHFKSNGSDIDYVESFRLNDGRYFTFSTAESGAGAILSNNFAYHDDQNFATWLLSTITP